MPMAHFTMRKVAVTSLLLTALCVAKPALADAGLDLTLSPLTFTINEGKTGHQVYTATFTNNFDFPLYLNGDFFSLTNPPSLDDTAFQGYFVFPTDLDGNLLDQPTIDTNGGTLTLPVFSVDIPNTTAPGQYGGVFSVQGGQTSGDYDTLASQEFTLNVLSSSGPQGPGGVPEPGQIALLTALAVGSLPLLKRRSRRR